MQQEAIWKRSAKTGTVFWVVSVVVLSVSLVVLERLLSVAPL